LKRTVWQTHDTGAVAQMAPGGGRTGPGLPEALVFPGLSGVSLLESLGRGKFMAVRGRTRDRTRRYLVAAYGEKPMAIDI